MTAAIIFALGTLGLIFAMKTESVGGFIFYALLAAGCYGGAFYIVTTIN